MIPVKHIDPDDIALYAMQLLPLDETEEMTLHMQHSAEARRVLSEIYSDLSVFAHSAEMHSPPAMARQRLMKHVAREKKAIPIDAFANAGAYAPRAPISLIEDEPMKKSFPAKVLPWVGWAIAAGLGAFSVNLYQQNEHMQTTVAAESTRLIAMQGSLQSASMVMDTFKDPNAVNVTLALTAAPLKPQPLARVAYVADKGALMMIASNLDPLKAAKMYELWVIPVDGQPIPAGSFTPDARGNATVVLPTLEKGRAAKAFGVTIEDADATPITPTTPIVLLGTVS